ncbi:MAG: polysaccharide deacetylase family protein [Chloroflexota bacterium]
MAAPETRGVRVLASAPIRTSNDRVPDVGIVYNSRGLWLTDTASGRAERVDRGPVPRQRALIPILMYHHVRPIDHKTANRYAGELTLPPAEFEQHLRYLQSRGIATVSMDDLVLHLQGRTELPSRSVILSFDDGYADNHQYALPLLKRYGSKATFFIATGFTGQGDYMSWSNLMELVAAGMEIGGHTISHVDLARSSAAARERELVEPRRLLEGNLGVAVRVLSYPSGAHNEEVMAAARKAGYVAAVTTQHGAVHDRGKMMALARVRISGYDTLPGFRWKIEQHFPSKGEETR